MRSMLAGLMLGLTVLSGAAVAKPTGMEIRDAWIRATPPGAPTAAAYLTITNHGPTTDRLTGGQTNAAQTVQVHEMSMSGGMMRMRPIPGGLAIGASATVKLTPNGDHLMFIGLKGPLVAGQHVKVTLNFTRAGPVTVDIPVRASAPAGGVAGMHM
jgi:copper(I)-binding protein